MNDPMNLARNAREYLAQGLAALQNPGVPPQVMDVAEHIAHAMSALHRIEATQGRALSESGPLALDAVRRALALLQSQPFEHPAITQALEAIAGSLGMVHSIGQFAAAHPPATSAVAQFGGTVVMGQGAAPYAPGSAGPTTQPSPAIQQPTLGYAQTAVQPQFAQPPPYPQQAPVAPRAAPPYAQPAPPYAQPAPPYAQPAAQYAQPAAQYAQPAAQYAQPAAQHAQPAQQYVPANPAPAFGAPRAEQNPYGAPPQQWQKAEHQAHAAAAWPGANAGVGAGQPAVARKEAAIRVEAELGAHSPTNFYKGLSGNDVVDAGGIFIATYQIPEIGQDVIIKVSMPGGYEFEAAGVVKWTRDMPNSGADAPPGYGAQFTQISPEGRQLVYRYVRNREPLFHDDL